MSSYNWFNIILWGTLVVTLLLAILKLALQGRRYEAGPPASLGEALRAGPHQMLEAKRGWSRMPWLVVVLPFILGWFYLTWPYVWFVLSWPRP